MRRPYQCNPTTARVSVHPTRVNLHRPPPGWDGGAAAPAPAGLEPELPFAESRVVVAAPALLIEARFRDVPLASRLLRADETRKFTVGAARGADAPVNPAYLPAAPEGAGHVLVEPLPGGFALNLAPAMRAELLTPVQVLPLRPDFGRAEAPLVLPADACLRVSCGEVAFDVYAAEPAAAVPPPTFGAVLRETGRYQLGVALVFAALLLIVRAVPEDASALAGDDLQRLRRLDSFDHHPPRHQLTGGRQRHGEQDAGRRRRAGGEGNRGKGGGSEGEADPGPPVDRGQGGPQGRAGGGGRDPKEPDARRARRRDDRFGSRGVQESVGARLRGGDVPRRDGGAADRERLRAGRSRQRRHRRGRRGNGRAHLRPRWAGHAR